MFRDDQRRLRFSATDVSNHLGCGHRTQLDRLAAFRELNRPFRDDAGMDALRERGLRHERAYLEHLASLGLQVVDLSDREPAAERVRATREAMHAGVDVIAQGRLEQGPWMGFPDVLIKVAEPSDLGSWSYEVQDTKLAQETKASAVLQLCLYSELLAGVQGRAPS